MSILPTRSIEGSSERTEVVMLVLSRKLNEKIVINGDIIVTIVKIDRNQVRLGIQAPGEVPVYREEILDRSADRLMAGHPSVAEAVVG